MDNENNLEFINKNNRFYIKINNDGTNKIDDVIIDGDCNIFRLHKSINVLKDINFYGNIFFGPRNIQPFNNEYKLKIESLSNEKAKHGDCICFNNNGWVSNSPKNYILLNSTNINDDDEIKNIKLNEINYKTIEIKNNKKYIWTFPIPNNFNKNYCKINLYILNKDDEYKNVNIKISRYCLQDNELINFSHSHILKNNIEIYLSPKTINITEPILFILNNENNININNKYCFFCLEYEDVNQISNQSFNLLDIKLEYDVNYNL